MSEIHSETPYARSVASVIGTVLKRNLLAVFCALFFAIYAVVEPAHRYVSLLFMLVALLALIREYRKEMQSWKAT